VRAPGWLAVETDPESHSRVRGRRPHDEMNVTGVEAIRDGAAWRVRRAGTAPIDQSPASDHWLRPNPEGAE
jgi:hypothetical protein